MIKKISIALLAVIALIACNNTKQPAEEEIAQITVQEFMDNAAAYIDKQVKIEGTVAHTCRHGGKKMFIFDENDEQSIKVTASDKIPQFDQSLEGSDVVVTGIVKELRVDEKYLDEWEAELMAADADKVEKEECEEGGEKGEECEEQKAENEENAEVAETNETETEEAVEGEKKESCPEEDGTAETLDTDNHHGKAYPQVEELRQELAESGKEYLSFFSLEAVSVEEKTAE